MAIKYKWLVERLTQLIEFNIKNGIEKLPTEKELCARYHVSRQTVRLSLSIIEEKGLIERRQGSGSFITGHMVFPEKNRIGVLISDDQEYIYPGVLEDIQKVLTQAGFSMQTHVTSSSTFHEREILSSLLSSPPRGLIVEGCKSALPNPNLDLYQRLMEQDVKIVFLYGNYNLSGDTSYIKDDNRAGAALLTNHLIQHGHTAIGGIFKVDDIQGHERFQGYFEAMQRNGLSVPDSFVSWFSSQELVQSKQAMNTDFLKKIVMDSLKHCTAVVCYNDEIAYWLIKELHLLGYHLPEDMAIAAFDNTYLSNSELLSVTTLSHEPHIMGKMAANSMLRKIKGLPVLSQEVPWELNEKQSTSSPNFN